MRHRICGIGLGLLLLVTSVTIAQNGEIPEPLPLVDEGDSDIVNFLLLGSDTSNPRNAGRTDALMIISVNRTAGAVNLLSIPRDLWVYVPDWQMQRINTVYAHGENDVEDSSGRKMLEATLRYNFGIEIDYYARVDFNGFKGIIDHLGSVEISVDCAIEDWRLISPDLDPTHEESWERFTLPVGVHRMDGDLALWYVRSRRTSSDFDRGRRQQDMMRALWRRIRNLGLLSQLADVWGQVTEVVETDVPLQALVDMAPLALSIDTSHVASYTFRQNIEAIPWTSPNGGSVLLPERDAVIDLMRRFMLPPTANQLALEHATIEVLNASGIPGFDRVAADRLSVEGFVPTILPPTDLRQEYTTIYDYTGRSKGSSLGLLQSVLRINEQGIVVEPNPNRSADFRVVIGRQYRSCTYGVIPPRPPSEATPEAS